MIMIKIPQTKVDALGQYINEGLHLLGRAMSCIEEMRQSGGMMGERNDMQYREPMMPGGMNYRYPSGGDMQFRDEDMWNERQGVRGTGRYSMYR